MSKTTRLYKIEMLIRSRGHVSFQTLLDELEVSRATLKRDLDELRDELGAPIEYDRDLNGYRFVQPARETRHELPGLWFSERELYSLLMANQMLGELDSDGVISRHLQPLLARIHDLLGGGADEARALLKRVKIVSAAKRPVPSRFFELVGEALLARRRIHLRYLTRSRGEVGEREVSPQRLVHYRNTWYLDAWCHASDELRRFALDAIDQAQVLPARARDMPLRQLEARMDGGYGAFTGGELDWATLVFRPQAAQWVSREQWHPRQQVAWLADGRYEMKLPFSDATELVMDVLRQGEFVEVVAPASLREAVQRRLQAAARQYAT
jgi:predicted DNA-binding transcriptional regulator YafY